MSNVDNSNSGPKAYQPVDNSNPGNLNSSKKQVSAGSAGGDNTSWVKPVKDDDMEFFGSVFIVRENLQEYVTDVDQINYTSSVAIAGIVGWKMAFTRKFVSENFYGEHINGDLVAKVINIQRVNPKEITAKQMQEFCDIALKIEKNFRVIKDLSDFEEVCISYKIVTNFPERCKDDLIVISNEISKGKYAFMAYSFMKAFPDEKIRDLIYIFKSIREDSYLTELTLRNRAHLLKLRSHLENMIAMKESDPEMTLDAVYKNELVRINHEYKHLQDRYNNNLSTMAIEEVIGGDRSEIRKFVEKHFYGEVIDSKILDKVYKLFASERSKMTWTNLKEYCEIAIELQKKFGYLDFSDHELSIDVLELYNILKEFPERSEEDSIVILNEISKNVDVELAYKFIKIFPDEKIDDLIDLFKNMQSGFSSSDLLLAARFSGYSQDDLRFNEHVNNMIAAKNLNPEMTLDAVYKNELNLIEREKNSQTDR